MEFFKIHSSGKVVDDNRLFNMRIKLMAKSFSVHHQEDSIKMSYGADLINCGMLAITGLFAHLEGINMRQKVKHHFDDLHPCRISLSTVGQFEKLKTRLR